MKNWLSIFSIAAIFLLNSCRDCVCTKIHCPGESIAIKLLANENDLDSNSFGEQEMAAFYLVRTDSDFLPIDSIPLDFNEAYNSPNFNRQFLLNEQDFSNFTSFQDYNFLIKNELLAQTDTISGITYTKESKQILCNECSGCEDEYVQVVDYENRALFFNGERRTDFDIGLLK